MKKTVKKVYVVEYNDRYGNGDDTSLEVVVKNRKEFKLWLEEHNKEREDAGEIEESKEEFTLHPIEMVTYC